MATVICQMSDCIHRSKRKLKKWKYSSGAPCYGCMLEAVTIAPVFDPEGEIRAVAGDEHMMYCRDYEKRPSDEPLNEEDKEDEGFE